MDLGCGVFEDLGLRLQLNAIFGMENGNLDWLQHTQALCWGS